MTTLFNLEHTSSQCLGGWTFSGRECSNSVILFCNWAVCRDFLMRPGIEARRWISMPKHSVVNNINTSEPWKSHWKKVIETVWSFCSENATAKKTIISAEMSERGICLFKDMISWRNNRSRVYTNCLIPYTGRLWKPYSLWDTWCNSHISDLYYV